MPRKKKQLPVEQVDPQLQETPEQDPQQMQETPAESPIEDTPQENPQDLQDQPDQSDESNQDIPENDFDMGEAVEENTGEVDEDLIKQQMAEQEAEDKASSLRRMARAQDLFRSAKDARRRFDKDWLARDLFRRGYQFTSSNSQTGTVNLTTNGRARIPVNLMWAYIRSIKNQVTSFNPKWEVLPEFKGKRSEQDARLAGKLLDYLFVKNNLNKKIKEAVIQGLIYSVGGPFEVTWDPYYDNGPNEPRGEVVVTLHDPFDVYIDPKATEMSDAMFLVKAVRTSIDEIQNNPNYREVIRKKLTTGSPKKAESEYKQFLLQTIQVSSGSSDENESVILKEIQMKERTDDGGIKIRYLTWCDELSEPLRDELVDQEDFDLEMFQADMNPLEMYGDSWAKNVMALNRVMNALESSIFEYNYRYAKGRLVIDKNAGIRAITNEHGSIIEKNPGREIRPLPLQPLPSSVESQIIRIKNLMEDISGVHEATLGRTPPGIKSGIGVAELKQSDSTNQDDIVQNLEQCLMRLGKKILKKVSEHYDTPRIRRVIGTGRLVEHFAVVGSGFISSDKKDWKIGEEKYPLARVNVMNELSVQIGSWLAYSKEARQKTLMDLAQAGLIDKETVLKHLEFPDVQEIVDKTRVEALIEMKRKEAPTDHLGVSQEQLAQAENDMLLEGSPMPVDPEDDHQLHIAIHSQILGESDNSNIVRDHIAEHRRAEKGGGQEIQSQPPSPQQQPAGQQMPPPGGMPAPQTPSAPQAPQGPQLPPGMPPLPPGMTPDMIFAPGPTPTPEASFFSAGVQEVPPTAGTILGGASNSLPTQ